MILDLEMEGVFTGLIFMKLESKKRKSCRREESFREEVWRSHILCLEVWILDMEKEIESRRNCSFMRCEKEIWWRENQ